MKTKKNVQTLPMQINVQSDGVREEDKIFYTTDDDETKEQHWVRKAEVRRCPVNSDPKKMTQTVFTNLTTQLSEIQIRLRKANQIVTEQSKDAIWEERMAKILHEEYSEHTLQQDARYRHNAINLERIAVKGDILTCQYFDETGHVKNHQILLPQYLLQDLLQSIHERDHRHPCISKMLQEFIKLEKLLS